MEYAEVYGNYYGTPRDFVLMKMKTDSIWFLTLIGWFKELSN